LRTPFPPAATDTAHLSVTDRRILHVNVSVRYYSQMKLRVEEIITVDSARIKKVLDPPVNLTPERRSFNSKVRSGSLHPGTGLVAIPDSESEIPPVPEC